MQDTGILETSINDNGLIYQIVQQIDLMKLQLSSSCTFIPAIHSSLT